MPRVPRERVERVAMRSEPESVLQEPRKAELNSNRIEEFGVAGGREIKLVPIEQFSCCRQNT